jgi:hypothetical protein
MPGFNGTGPLGAGPMTGRGGGYCMSYVGPDSRFNQGSCQNGWYSRRRFHAAGLHCWAMWPTGAVLSAPVYAPPLNSEQELNFLREQAENLEKALEQIKKRIKELENKD